MADMPNRIPDVKAPLLLNLLGLGMPQVSLNLQDQKAEARLQGQLQLQQDAAAQQAQAAEAAYAGALGFPTAGREQQAGLLAQLGQFDPTAARELLGQAQKQDAYLRGTQALGLPENAARVAADLRLAGDDETARRILGQVIGRPATEIDSLVNTMNQRFMTQMDAPAQVSDAVQQIDNALNTGNSLSALAAVIKLAKVLDPTSVVREGEVTTVEGGIGIADQLIRKYNRFFGQGFSAEGAAQIRQTVDAVARPVLDRGARIQQEYQRAADLAGIPYERVVLGIGYQDPGLLGGPARQASQPAQSAQPQAVWED